MLIFGFGAVFPCQSIVLILSDRSVSCSNLSSGLRLTAVLIPILCLHFLLSNLLTDFRLPCQTDFYFWPYLSLSDYCVNPASLCHANFFLLCLSLYILFFTSYSRVWLTCFDSTFLCQIDVFWPRFPVSDWHVLTIFPISDWHILISPCVKLVCFDLPLSSVGLTYFDHAFCVRFMFWLHLTVSDWHIWPRLPVRFMFWPRFQCRFDMLWPLLLVSVWHVLTLPSCVGWTWFDPAILGQSRFNLLSEMLDWLLFWLCLHGSVCYFGFIFVFRSDLCLLPRPLVYPPCLSFWQDLFRVHDLSQRGRISVQSMKQLLEESMNRKLADDSPEWTTFLNSVELVSCEPL